MAVSRRRGVTLKRAMRGRYFQRKGSPAHLHPGLLNSHPPRNEGDSTRRATTTDSFTAEMQPKPNEIRGSLINRIERPTSQRSLTPATLQVEREEPPTLSPVPVTPVFRVSALFDEHDIWTNGATLRRYFCQMVERAWPSSDCCREHRAHEVAIADLGSTRKTDETRERVHRGLSQELSSKCVARSALHVRLK